MPLFGSTNALCAGCEQVGHLVRRRVAQQCRAQRRGTCQQAEGQAGSTSLDAAAQGTDADGDERRNDQQATSFTIA